MGRHSSIASLWLVVGSVAAKTCQNFTIPVDIASRQGLFKTFPIEENADVTAFSQSLTRNGHNFTNELLQGYQTVKGSFNISAQFCHPDGGINSSTVQALSHGIGFDKTYWDLSYNGYNYSYVEIATKSGYSTLAIDRFGIGNSSHGDPLNTIQAQAEVEALNAVTVQLREGKIPQISQKFDKVIHVGHSFGSVQSYWLSALYPNNTDGLVLTGWSGNGSFIGTTIAAWNLHSARLNQPLRFGNSTNAQIRQQLGEVDSSDTLIDFLQAYLSSNGINLSAQEIWNEVATTEVLNLLNGYNYTVTPLDYPSGYISTADSTADQYVFLLPGFFDIGIGNALNNAKQPVTTGELLTLGSAPSHTSFSGPVLVITGQQDQVFCGGECYAPGTGPDGIPGLARPAFPNASVFEAYIQPNTGHGLNANYNATAAYKVVQSFLGSHGLGA